MENSPRKLSKDSDCPPTVPNDPEIEIEICTFYEQILKELYKLSGLKFLEISKSLANIRSYKNPDVEEHNIVSFDEKADRLAYIFAYSVIHSVVMYDRFSRLLKANPSMLEKIISMKKIRLCILGGGPGFEAASVCKLLSNILINYGGVERPPLQIHVTVIDIYAGWEEDAKLIISSTQQNLCSSNNVEIDFSFIGTDLTSDFSEDVRNAIKKSHIVTMFKFLSDVNEASYSKSEIPEMIQKIIESMSFKACLFFLDTSGGGLFKKIDALIDKLPQTSRIYGPCLFNCHMLSMDSFQKFSDALKHIFRFLHCTNRTTISCSAWIKVRHIINVNDLTYNAADVSINGILHDSEEQKSKTKVPRVRMKKVLQSAAKLKEWYDGR